MRLRWAGLLLALWTLVAVAVPWLPLQPDHIALEAILAPPGGAHWLGADDVGRPVLDRLLVGARTSFWVACWVVGLSLVAGTLVGSLAGYLGGAWDRALVLVMDIFMAFPGILLAIALAESILIVAIGGMLGLLLGAGFAAAMSGTFAAMMGVGLSLSPGALTLGIGIMLVTGIAAGLFPALKARRLTMVEALMRG